MCLCQDYPNLSVQFLGNVYNVATRCSNNLSRGYFRNVSDDHGALYTVRYAPVVAGRRRSVQRRVEICWSQDVRAAVRAAQAGKTQLILVNSQQLLEPVAETLQEPQQQPAVLRSCPVVATEHGYQQTCTHGL